MKTKPDKNTEGSTTFLQMVGVAVFCALPILLFANGPSWWADRGIISLDPVTGDPRPADDYAAANQGQVKNIAKAAVAEMNVVLPGGAGDELNGLPVLSGTNVSANDYAAVNLGQLKALAKPFYDRLIALGYRSQYPWTGTANDYAMANIGQVKNLFSFDPANFPLITSPVIVTTGTGVPFSYTLTATNTPTSFSVTGLPGFLTFNSTTGLLSGTATAIGIYNMTMSASNASGVDSQALVISVGSGSSVPVINSGTTAIATAGSSFAYQITASNNPTGFEATNLPSNLTFNPASAVISGTTTTSGTYTINLSASNVAGTGTAALSLVVNDGTGSGASTPVLTGTLIVTGTTGQPFSYTITATNSPTSFNAVNLPTGLHIDTATGVISGTITSAGLYIVPINAINGSGTGSGALNVNIQTVNQSLTAVKNSYYNYSVNAGSNITGFTATGLPPGLSFNTASGVIFGTPTTTGTYAVTIGISTLSGSNNISLAINVDPAHPVIQEPLTAEVQAGSFFRYTVSANNDPTGFSVGSLPEGLAYNPVTRVILGTPTVPGNYSIDLSATNALGTGTGVLALTIDSNASAPPFITSGSIVYGKVNTSFSFAVTAYNSPTSFSASGLPTGLSLDATTGVISGTSANVGVYPVSLGVGNSSGTSTQEMMLSIESGSAMVTGTICFQPGVKPTSSYQMSTATIKNDTEDSDIANLASYGLTVGGDGTQSMRGLLSFDPSMLPQDATIVTANLQLFPSSGPDSISVELHAIAHFYEGVACWNINNGYESDLLSSLTIVDGGGVSGTWASSSNFVSAAQNATQDGVPLDLMLVAPTAESGGTGLVGLADKNDGTPDHRPKLSLSYTTSSAPVIFPTVLYEQAGYSLNSSIPALHAPASWSATGLPSGISINTSTGILSGTATTTGTFVATVQATNANGTGNGVVTINVGYAPTITGTLATSGTIGSAFNYTIAATNAPTTFTATGLPSGFSIDSNTGVISGSPLVDIGNYNVTIAAANLYGTTSGTLVVNVAPEKPVISSQSYTITQGASFSYPVSFENPYIWFTASSVPSWMTFTDYGYDSAIFTGTASTTGTFAVTLTGSNSTGVSDPAVWTFIVLPPGPYITSPLSGSGTVGDYFQYYLTCMNSGSSTVMNVTGLPTGLVFEQQNDTAGQIYGTPSSTGTFNVTISATNAIGSDTESLVLTIEAAETSPAITNSGTLFAAVGDVLSYQVVANNDAILFSADRLPQGLTINGTTGLISGTAMAADSMVVSLNASNEAGVDTKSLLIVITANPSDQQTVFQQGVSPSSGYTMASLSIISGSATEDQTINTGTMIPVGRSSTGDLKRALLGFDVSSLPPNTIITSASLVLSSSGSNSSGGPLQVEIHETGEPFDTNQANWSNNSAFKGSLLGSVSVDPAVTSGTNIFYGTSVFTQVLQQAVTESGMVYLNIASPMAESGTTANYIGFNTRASNSAFNPELFVTYTMGSPTASPLITSPSVSTGTVGTLFGYTITATNLPTGFGASNLPSGLTLNGTTGEISGTATAVGSTVLTGSATNAIGTGTMALTLNIDSVVKATDLTLISGTNQCGVSGTFAPYPLVVEASVLTSGSSVPLAQTLVTFTAPQGLGLLSATNTGSLPAYPVLTVPTGTNGLATAYLIMPQTLGTTLITASSGTAQPVVFVETSVASSSGTASGLGNDVPVLSIASGANQTGPAGQTLVNPVIVQAANHLGQPIGSLPLNFVVISGSTTGISSSSSGTSGTSMTLSTDSKGQAAIYIKLSGTNGALNKVSCTGTSATGVTASVYLTATTGTNTTNSANGSGIANITKDSDPDPLLPPTGLAVEAPDEEDPTSITLSWTASVSSDVDNIIVQRQISGGDWSTVATLGATETSYDDSIDDGTHYSYRLIAVRDGMQSPPSASGDYVTFPSDIATQMKKHKSGYPLSNPMPVVIIGLDGDPTSSIGPTGFDPSEMQNKGIEVSTLTSPWPSAEGALPFVLSQDDIMDGDASYYVITYDDTNFTIYEMGGIEASDGLLGKAIPSGYKTYGNNIYYAAVNNPPPNNDASTNVKIEAYDNDGKAINTLNFKFVYHVPVPVKDYSLPIDEASGPKYRKIGMNGLPMPDEKPQHAEETDQEKEETFVDALTLGLRHSTTDVYLPVAGSDLSVSSRRDVRSEVWSKRNGLRPHEQPDHPFGICWSSNLAPNIHFSPGTGGEPGKAYVSDETGATHTFVIWYATDDYSHLNPRYFPMPTAKNEQTPNLESLTADLTGSVARYTFKKKYGGTLTYEAIPLNLSISADRVVGSTTANVNTYARLVKAADRLGNTINYQFIGMNNLVPSKITVLNQPNTSVSIQQNSHGLITAIWDAKGNETDFNYTSFNDGTGTAYKLTSVVTPDGATTTYDYDTEDETDATPHASADPGNTFTHADLKSITDPLGHTYTFNYGLDKTKLNYMNTPGVYSGYFTQTGLPRNITAITLPDGHYAVFANNSKVWVEYEGGLAVQKGQRQIAVTDATGFVRTYRFEDSKVVPLPKLNPNSTSDSKVVCYQAMYIDYGLSADSNYMGVERYVFDINASMAIKQITDFSGNVTSFEHGNVWTDDLYRQIMTGTSVNGFYGDPTKQTNALGGTKTFVYTNGSRIMTDVTDEEGRHTHYDVDALERRTKETIYLSGSTSPVQVTDFEYGSKQYPGFQTKKTVEALGGSDPDWVKPLVTQFVPDTNGRVAQQIVDPDGLHLVSSYTYDANGNKLTATDPKGNTMWFSYDSRNRLITTTFADGTLKQFVYDARGNKVIEYDENGTATLYHYDSLNRLDTQARDMNGSGTINARSVDLVTSYTYNNVNSKLTVTDPNGNTTTMVYDPIQRLSQKIEPLVNGAHYTTSFVYGTNSGGNGFDSSGFKPTQSTDPRGVVTDVTYDGLYRPLVKTVKDAGGNVMSTSSSQYDKVGNSTITTDPLGHQTTVAYDALNRPVMTTYADGTFTTTAYTSTGLKWKAQDELWNASYPLRHVSQMEFDGAGRQVAVFGSQVDNGHGTPTMQVTTTFYDAAGNVAATINPLGNEWDYSYDARNRKLQEFDPPVTDAEHGNVTARPIKTWQYDPAGRVVAVIDARGNETDSVYDAANRVTDVNAPAVAAPGGGTARPNTHSTYDQNGNVLTLTDANSHTTTNTYDTLNRLHTTQDAASITVTYEYDEVGNRTRVKDGKNQSTIFAYDALNRNTMVTDAGGFVTQFRYDGMNKIQRIDARHQVTSYVYDDRNRLLAVSYASADANNSLRNYTYDKVGNLLSVTEPAKGGVADVAYTYDGLNRQITETSGGLTHTYRLDLAGNRLKTIYGGTTRTITSTYDALNRLDTMTEDPTGANRFTAYAYDLNGNILLKTSPNGDTDTYTFDALNRALTQIAKTGGSVSLYEYDYAYDLAGNVLSVVETYPGGLNNRTVANTYDAINRLGVEAITTGTAIISSTYTYDYANNRSSKVIIGGTSAGTTSYTYNGINQLTAYSDGTTGVALTYDANGNRATRVIGSGTDTYSYDFENRLVGLVKGIGGTGITTGTYAYTYDYRTRRVLRDESGAGGGEKTRLVFSAATSVQEYSLSGTTGALTVEYVRGSDYGGGVGGVLYTLRSGSPSYTHENRRGDVIAKTDGSGSLTYQAAYEAFGKRTQEQGATLDRQKANTKDEDTTGLLNEGQRYRDLETGVFLTKDPAGFVNGPNVYTYVKQNPWTAFDPEGLAAVYVVYPDYPITVSDSWSAKITVASFWYRSPTYKEDGKTKSKDLGHSGVLLIDPTTGQSNYYEYGRYDKEEKGIVRTKQGPVMELDEHGNPTKESMEKVMKQLSKEDGKGGRVKVVVTTSSKEDYDKQKAFADKMMKENDNPNRAPYDPKAKSCGTFARDTVNQGLPADKQLPTNDPRPKHDIEQQKNGTKMEYDPAKDKTGQPSAPIPKEKEQTQKQE